MVIAQLHLPANSAKVCLDAPSDWRTVKPKRKVTKIQWQRWICMTLWSWPWNYFENKRRKTTVQNSMGLLNSGTLNRGRNLCVTVATDHLTGGWIPWWIATICEKYLRKGASTNQLSQRILFGSLEWLSLHLCFWPIEIPPIREHSINRNTLRIRLIRGRKSLERNSCGSRLWAGG